MTVETDSSGRLYLSAELRQKYGDKFHVVEYEDRLTLVPIDDDPLQAARDAAGDAFDDISPEELRKRAREQATADAKAGFDRGQRSTAEREK
jgi:hypothetical protein